MVYRRHVSSRARQQRMHLLIGDRAALRMRRDSKANHHGKPYANGSTSRRQVGQASNLISVLQELYRAPQTIATAFARTMQGFFRTSSSLPEEQPEQKQFVLPAQT